MADITQRQLAAVLGVSPAFVSRIENGDCGFPPDRIAKLPAPIRDAVIEALIDESHETIERLRAARERLAQL